LRDKKNDNKGREERKEDKRGIKWKTVKKRRL